MRRLKANVVIAAFFGVCTILCSIGYVRGLEDESAYTSPDLLLTQGQAKYDLCKGIGYNRKKYELSVSNEGDFDINKPGSYMVEYLLTPLDGESELDPVQTKLPNGGGGIEQDTSASTQTSAPSETSAPAETAAPPETSAPAETAAPPETSAPAETVAPPETSAPAETAAPPETSAPAETSAPPETSTPVETAAPSETPAPEETAAPPEETAAPPETSAPAETAAPSETPAPAETAAPKDTSSSEKAAEVQETAAESETAMRAAKEKIFLMEGLPELEKPLVPKEASVPEATPGQGTAASKEMIKQVNRPDPEKSSSSEADLVLEQISFTRTVVVREAVQYQYARFDIDTDADPLTDMEYDSVHYGLAVLDDGGFNSRRIGEYHILYRLINRDNGKMVTDLERYMWITASEVTFNAPELSLCLNQTVYDLQEGIDYDAEQYALTTINPDSIDTSVEGEQRVMFYMTALAEGEGISEATPAEAVHAVLEESPTQETAAVPEETSEAAVPEETPTANGPGASEASPSSAAKKLPGTGPTLKTIEERPVVAIFGRDVKVEVKSVVMIDAPPLVVMEGNAAGQDLLEGVTAKDESGNAVALQVANRTELDAAAGYTASENTAPAPETSASENTAPAPETSASENTVPAPEEPAAAFAMRNTALGATVGAQVIVPEDEVLPAGLPVGEYKVTLSSVHPATNEIFTAERTVSVRAAERVNILGSGVHTVDVAQDNRPIKAIGRTVNLTLTGTGTIEFNNDLPNGIDVISGANLNLTLGDGADITVKGKPGEDGAAEKSVHAAGGGAGICVEKGGTLTITGNGKLTAFGGNAGAGGIPTGTWHGGGGGGGAGAAIGGNGGTGGEGGWVDQTRPSYVGRLWGGNAAKIPEVGIINIPASNVFRNDGKGNDSTKMERLFGCATGGGGMPANSIYIDFGQAERFSGGSGGGGGGATMASAGAGSAGFGQGFGRASNVKDDQMNTIQERASGGYIYPVSNIGLSAEGSPGRLDYETLAEAFDKIGGDARSGGNRKNYTVNVLTQYSFGAEDQAALSMLSGLNPDITITLFTDRNPMGNLISGLNMMGEIIKLPQGSAGVDGAAFKFHDIELKDCTVIAANSSKLTLGAGISTTRRKPIVVGGIYEGASVAANLVNNGNTWLEVDSGSYSEIYGGNWHYWNGVSSSASSTIVGDTTLKLSGVAGSGDIGPSALPGKARADKVYGGSYMSVGNANMPTVVRQTGTRTVTLSGTAEVTDLYAGSNSSYPQLLIEDSISPGTVRVSLERLAKTSNKNITVQAAASAHSGLPKQGSMELAVSGKQSVTNIYDFEAVRMSPGSELTVNGMLGRSAPFEPAEKPAMLLDFQNGASMILKKTGGTAGSFRIEGDGNKLTLPQTGSARAALTLDASTPNDRVNNAQLELCYPAKTAVKSGDKLLRYTTEPKNAMATDYVPQIGDYAVLANKGTGYVYLEIPITLETNGGLPQYYESIAAVMNSIGSGNGNYEITIRKQNYKLTQADGLALSQQGGNAASITVTSSFRLTDKDAIGPGEVLGESVTRTVLVGTGTTEADPKADLSLKAPVNVIKDTILQYEQSGCALYANGHKLTVGPNVQIYSDHNYFPVVYGGAADQSVGAAELVLTSGNYGGIYGGGHAAGATVAGTSVTFGGNAQLYGSIYGGGRDGAVTGSASLNITGGEFHAAVGGTAGKLVGGGEKGNVAGNVTVSIEDASDVSLPSIYGADPHGNAGTVGGSIFLTIVDGGKYGTIQGGRSGLSTLGRTATITFRGGSLNVKDISEFDVLNLGGPGTVGTPEVPEVPEVPGDEKDRTTLFLGGKLQGQDGELRFWGGSVLTLQGTSMDKADLLVKSIRTDATQNRSHLHMYKGPGSTDPAEVSRPLHILDKNTSQAGNRLVLGEYGPGATHEGGNVGEADDKLLLFDVQENADSLQYVSDFQGLSIVLDGKDPGAVKLGISSEINMTLTGVSHTNAGVATQADEPKTAVIKTLKFEIKSSIGVSNPGEEGVPGSPITGAYVSKSWRTDDAWVKGGPLPAGGTAIDITRESPNSSRWDGTVTMPIAPPTGAVPEYYFAHARDDSGQKESVIVLDVHSPLEEKNPVVARNGEGDYTFTVQLQDEKPEKPPEVSSEIIYTASGLRQLGWAVGTASNRAGEKEALEPKMVKKEGGELQDVITIDSTTAAYPFTFTVKAGMLSNDSVVYLYAKDAMGNTGVYPIPLNNNRIDIEVPLWAGTVALRGEDMADPQLIAPKLYVVNNSMKPVRAELVGAEIPANQRAETGKLQLTDKKIGPWTDKELNLMVKPINDGLGSSSFPITSVAELNTSTVDLGLMPAGSEPNHGVSFTFTALYDPKTIMRTSGWSQCTLTYRFSLDSSAPVTNALVSIPAEQKPDS